MSEGVREGLADVRPERLALLEADGALLTWDALADGPPHAQVWDEARAATWLWQFADFDPVVARYARRAAFADWARGWWPASHAAGIPPLDPRIVTLDRAVASAAVEHLLDGTEALERELASALAAAAGLERDSPAVIDDEVAGLIAGVRELAEDAGLDDADLGPWPAQRREYALAATGSDEDADDVLARGAELISPHRLAPGSADPFAPAHWQLLRGTRPLLRVTVPRAPRHPADFPPPQQLLATFAGLSLWLEPGPAGYLGEREVEVSVLLRQPVLAVHSTDFAGDEPPLAVEERAAILDAVRARLRAPATAYEREAARRGLR